MDTLPQSEQATDSRPFVSVRVDQETWTQMVEEQARLVRAGQAKPNYAEMIERAWAAYKRELHNSAPPPKRAA